MLCGAKEELPDGIYIRFRTDGSLFNLWRLFARTKTTKELITELLFADDCVVSTPSARGMQSSYQHRWHQPKRSGTLHLPG